ncbi:MAG: DUF4954 family protein [Bacteroidales bacterium]|nr:DUF4954 family protein [Bacteroidales bacterium]
MKEEYRKLTQEERTALATQSCACDDWDAVLVRDGFNPKYVRATRFSGTVRLGRFDKAFTLPGGMKKHSGLYHATLHNVTVGDNCCIENVKNYIANYTIGEDSFIENVDIILVDGKTSFGNGVQVSVLNETGGREVAIYDRLSSQQAYIMALYRHRPELIAALKTIVDHYSEHVSAETGVIGSHVTIADAGYIKNVRIGDYAKIEGASRLKNGSINSNEKAPVHIGVGVIGDDFIICSGASVEDGVTFSRCFIGQACKLGHNYSASDSLFFANCQGENGEACAIFAGPYTVTHHKSTLLIAGMFSFMNAGSGSNQSNHMYKLGPIHQGIMERGAKTSSDSYILWPAKVGAFSLVMGRHVGHQDTSDLPFSYLIEKQGVTMVVPGANLKSVGTIRDGRKWPQRDGRKDPDRLDCVNCNLLSPYTVRKMLSGISILKGLQKLSGETSDIYAYQSGNIKKSSLLNGLKLYGMAIDKFLGNSLISRIGKADVHDVASLRAALKPTSDDGLGDWVDIGGMLAPKGVVDRLLGDIESGAVPDAAMLGERIAAIHANYYDYEWTWAAKVIESYYGVDLSVITPEEVISLVEKWRTSVLALDNLLFEDARKEFSLSAMTSFGADGDEKQRDLDFQQVRGSAFDSDPFVVSIKDHIVAKNALGDKTVALMQSL